MKIRKEKAIKSVEIIAENICELSDCNCGWNITIGGKNKEDLRELKRLLKIKRVVIDD